MHSGILPFGPIENNLVSLAPSSEQAILGNGKYFDRLPKGCLDVSIVPPYYMHHLHQERSQTKTAMRELERARLENLYHDNNFVHESGQMAPELLVACFWRNSKTTFKSFKRIGTKILDVDNNKVY
jgi:hypothetical protein